MTAKTLYNIAISLELFDCKNVELLIDITQVGQRAEAESEKGDREKLIKFIAPIHLCFCSFISLCKVLLVGLFKDQGSPLKMLRSPRMVVQDVMPIIWQKITYNWQVFCLSRHAKTRTLCSYVCANFWRQC